MFDIIPKLLSSIASFLFPLFASYKALKTSDPAQLTPWLMYWVVLACVLLVESWTDWFLAWIPLYSYLRLLFLLYLVLPQTQGARIIYTTYIHPYLEDNENAIEDFIATTHDKMKAAGMAYVKKAIEVLRTTVFGMAPDPSAATVASSSATPQQTQSYAQSLLARFQVPQARWNPVANGAVAGSLAGQDVYNLLAGAWGSIAPSSSVTNAVDQGTASNKPVSSSSSIIPPNLQTSAEKISFLAAQRERLNLVLSVLDRETLQLQSSTIASASVKTPPPSLPNEDTLRRPSTPSARSVASGLSKSRSEVDFEKIDAESGAEDNSSVKPTPATTPGGSWMPWAWGSSGTGVGSASGDDFGAHAKSD